MAKYARVWRAAVPLLNASHVLLLMLVVLGLMLLVMLVVLGLMSLLMRVVLGLMLLVMLVVLGLMLLLMRVVLGLMSLVMLVVLGLMSLVMLLKFKQVLEPLRERLAALDAVVNDVYADFSHGPKEGKMRTVLMFLACWNLSFVPYTADVVYALGIF